MISASMAADTLLLAGSLSLTGRYAPQGRLAAAGLHQAVQDVRNRGGVRMAHRHLVPDVVILDDASTREGVRRSLDRVSGADLLLGPYGSNLVAEAARWAADAGAGPVEPRRERRRCAAPPGVVSVGTPSSRYLSSVLDAVATELPEARVMVAVGRGAFGRSVAHGARDAAERLGMTISWDHDPRPGARGTECRRVAHGRDLRGGSRARPSPPALDPP